MADARQTEFDFTAAAARPAQPSTAKPTQATGVLISGNVSEFQKNTGETIIKMYPGHYDGVYGKGKGQLFLTENFVGFGNEDQLSGDAWYCVLPRNTVGVTEGYKTFGVCVQHLGKKTRMLDFELADADTAQDFIAAAKGSDVWVAARDRLAEKGAAYRKTLG